MPPTTQSPTLLRRLSAIIYDGFLMLAVLFVASAPLLLMSGNTQHTVNNYDIMVELQPFFHSDAELWAYRAYLLAVMMLFFTGFWYTRGQTLGMRAWRLRLQSLSGNAVTFQQCLVRWLAAWLSFGCLGLGYLWVWVDKDRLSWHDRLSHTQMVVE